MSGGERGEGGSLGFAIHSYFPLNLVIKCLTVCLYENVCGCVVLISHGLDRGFSSLLTCCAFGFLAFNNFHSEHFA